MAKTANKTIDHVIGIVLNSEMERKVNFALSSENSTFQDEITRLAKHDGVSPLEYYANLLFSREFQRKLDYFQSRAEAEADMYYRKLLARGFSEDVARKSADQLLMGIE